MSSDCNLDPYTASDAALAACGMQSFPVQNVIRNADGSTEYLYNVDGVQESEIEPPPGFDALTASAAERARLGILPEPPALDLAAHAAWVNYARNIKFAPPDDRVIQGSVYHDLNKYANYVGYENLPDHWTESLGAWQEPQGQGGCNEATDAATWVGLYDVPDGVIGQAGTAIGSTEPTHEAWYEVFPRAAQYINFWATHDGTPTGAPAQSFKVYVQWDNSTNTFTFTFLNVDTGTQKVKTATWNDPFSDPESVYITERGSFKDSNGQLDYYELANFDKIYWSQAAAANSTQAEFYTVPYNTDDMVDKNGSVIADPSDPNPNNSDVFINRWYGCGL